MWNSGLLAGLAIVLTFLTVRFFKDLKKVSYHPGLRSAFGSLSLVGAIIPTSSVNPGLDWFWMWRNTVWNYYATRTISQVSFINGVPLICTASMEVAKQVLNGESGYWKSPDTTIPLLLWGDNVIAANGEVYKRHRKIAGPAFTGTLYSLVAQDTVRLYHEMIEGERWDNVNEISVQSINDILAKFTLGIITRCAFGVPFPWLAPEDEEGMSFVEALTIVSKGVIVRLATPRWAYKLPIKRLHDIDTAYRRLSTFMRDLVSTRRSELMSQTEDDDSQGRDLLTRLVTANQANSKNVLDDSELIGNIFAFSFAGHETTAHTLSATLALLALYEDEQAKVYDNICQALPDGRNPTFDDFGHLGYVLACFNEASRMFPAGSAAVRDTTDTVVLKLPPRDGGGDLVVSPGVRVVVDLIGIHYDPELFPNPEHFDPTRWYGVQESDLTFFGLGPRACLGRKFAMTEAVCLLTLLIREWKIDVWLQDGETKEQWKKRVLQGGLVGLGFGIRDAPVKLKRRL